jgi:hypothetical protein
MNRRTFLNAGVASAALGALFHRTDRAFGRNHQQIPGNTESLWTSDGIFRQSTIDTSRKKEGIIRARVDGVWKDYTARPLDDGFFSWNLEDRFQKLAVMKEGRMPDWSGAHNAAVATYGRTRGDSDFTLNNAVKGMGLCPKEDRMEELIGRLVALRDKSQEEKFGLLESLYKNRDLWDPFALVSLELYAAPDFETHTFLNQMENPVSTIVFLDVPSYEIRSLARLLHPKDPGLTPTEERTVRYINTIHTFMHSHFKSVVPAAVYYVVEVFDNSPAGMNQMGKKGRRIV